jgi:gas vesicle protein
MNAPLHEHRQHRDQDYGFAIGLLTGTFVGAGVGAGLAFWFAPRLATLHQRVSDSAKDLGERVTDRYAQVSSRIDKAASDLTQKGQDVRDGVADVVAHGAHEVERYAKAAKTR